MPEKSSAKSEEMGTLAWYSFEPGIMFGEDRLFNFSFLLRAESVRTSALRVKSLFTDVACDGE